MKIYKLDNINLDNITLLKSIDNIDIVDIIYNNRSLLIELPYMQIYNIEDNYIYLSLKSINGNLTKLIINFFELFDKKIIEYLKNNYNLLNINNKSIIQYKSIIHDVSSSIGDHFNVYKDIVLKLDISKSKVFDNNNKLLDDYNEKLKKNVYIKIILHLKSIQVNDNICGVNMVAYQIKL